MNEDREPRDEMPLLQRLIYWRDAPEMRDFHLGRECIKKDCADAAEDLSCLRRIIGDIRVLYHSGQFKQFEGEPWLRRVLNIDLQR